MGVRHVTVRLTVNQANWLGGALPLGDVRVKVLEALAKPPRKATGRPFKKKVSAFTAADGVPSCATQGCQNHGDCTTCTADDDKPAFAPGSPGEALNKEMNNGQETSQG